MGEVDLTVVIPCYNEAEVISSTLRNVVGGLGGCGMGYEILVIDDCSTDGTGELVDRFAADNPTVRVRSYRNGRNRGSGYAHRHGAELAEGRWYMVVPGDDDLPVSAIADIGNRIGSADILLPYPREEDFDKRSSARKRISRIFMALLRAISGHELKYFHSPAVYPTELVRRLDIRVDGFGYYSELLCAALGGDSDFIEFPVAANYSADEKTTAFRPKNVVSVGRTLVRIAVRRVLGAPRRNGEGK